MSIRLEIANYFPELPGYSTEYEIKMICNGIEQKKGEYIIKTYPDNLIINDNIVVVSARQKEMYDKFIVEATDKITKEKAELTITPRKWKVNFEDDFDGDSLNTDIWSLFEYKHTNFNVKDGVLTLLAERIVKPSGKGIYTASGIRTLSKYSSIGGCFMARMKSPDRGGCNSAFWLMPEGEYTKDAFFMNKEFPDKGCSEIDIVEYSASYGAKFPITQHFWNRNTGEHLSRPYWGEVNKPIYNDYHDYACVWDTDGIYYYFDGKPMYANRDIITHKDTVAAYIVLSTNSGKIHEGLEWLGECTDDMFPFETAFDWVKAYR
ncbi:MAG: family 16 glycosylhydrolase [Eubacteriales bacterium]|nr:family 16 glycosylhydrolase [Eubacteriales bacterium]